jgi:hypothetical protein
MLDITRVRKKLSRQELIAEMKPNDLVTLSEGNGIVHIVFPATGTICRRSMIETGTETRDARRWDILDSTPLESYEKTVMRKFEMRPCGHCLSWYR